MIAWFIATLILLVWNVVYCTIKVREDFRGDRPAQGVFGLFAVAASVSIIILAAVGLMIASSGI